MSENKTREFLKHAFSENKLNGLKLKNRFIKAPTYEGLQLKAKLLPSFKDHHLGVARGGAAMTIIANCAVSVEGRAYRDQLILDDKFSPQLEELVKEIHAEGCAVALQINHCGANKRYKAPTFAPSKHFNFRLGQFTKAMTEDDIERTIQDFVSTAKRANEIGIDAIEIQASHGYLISQFLSPLTNHREDAWGGAIENRSIFPVLILDKIRRALNPGFPVFAQINLSDAHPKGLKIDEALIFAQILETEGVDALALSSGFTPVDNYHDIRGDLPLKDIIAGERNFFDRMYLRLFGKRAYHHYPFTENFLLPHALRIRKQLSLPMILTGGVNSVQAIASAFAAGFDYVAMARPLICQNHFIDLLKNGEAQKSPCNHCNLCVAYASKGIECHLKERS